MKGTRRLDNQINAIMTHSHHSNHNHRLVEIVLTISNSRDSCTMNSLSMSQNISTTGNRWKLELYNQPSKGEPLTKDYFLNLILMHKMLNKWEKIILSFEDKVHITKNWWINRTWLTCLRIITIFSGEKTISNSYLKRLTKGIDRTS